MANIPLEQLERNVDRWLKTKDEWRKSAIVSLAVGNGGGLAALAAWAARAERFELALKVFVPGMWIFAAGLLFAGALPFAAWWNAHLLSETAVWRSHVARSMASKDAVMVSGRPETSAEELRRASGAVRASIYLLRALLGASILCFIAATILTLWGVSTSDVLAGGSGT